MEICFLCESSRRLWLIITLRLVVLVLDVNEMQSSVGRWLSFSIEIKIKKEAIFFEVLLGFGNIFVNGNEVVSEQVNFEDL